MNPKLILQILWATRRTAGKAIALSVGLLFTTHELWAAPAVDPAEERVVAAVSALKVGLKKELEQAMAAGGPDNALGVCRDRAPALATELATKYQVQVGRSSHKLRNPSNVPRAWVKPIIDEWLKTSAAERKPRVVSVSKNVVGYIEPIATGAFCLACHGEVPAATQAKIKALYPSDQATGFEEGDLRGVFWAEGSNITH